MSKTVRNIASIVMALLMVGGTAFAADQLDDEIVEYTPVEFGTGWYIRGDIGGAFREATSDVTLGTFSGNVGMGHPISVSVGGGYHFNNYIRGEFQLGQLNSLDISMRNNPVGCGSELVLGVLTPISGSCHVALDGQPAYTSFMANAYVDLGTYAGFTPYVGAGAGTSYVTWNSFTSQFVCIGGGAADCGAGGGAGFNQLAEDVFNTNSSFVLAYNVMAGVAYDISENVKLDLGYRWLTMGEVNVASASNNPGILTDFNSGTLDVHEVRVGLRLEIW